MRTRLFAALMFVAVSASAQLHITSISPSSGPATGGTPVVIQLSGPLAPCPILPPLPSVTFDSTSVTVEQLSETTFRAIAPPHAAGTVDVHFSSCGNPELVAERAYEYLAPGSPDPASFERVLLPVFFFGPGAEGSQWVTTAFVNNGGEAVIEFANAVFMGDPVCPAVCGCSARRDLRPHETSSICSAFAYPGGLVLFAPKSASEELHFNLRIRDVSRSKESAGTDIPVARERDLRSKIVLMNIPGEARFRTALRIYDVEGRDGVQVRMRIFRNDSPEGALVDRIVTLSQPIRDIVYDPFSQFPAYAYIPNPVAEVPIAAPFAGPFRIELAPLAPLDRFWALLSITNNDTQQVTIVAP